MRKSYKIRLLSALIFVFVLYIFSLSGCDNQEINTYYSTRHVLSGMNNIDLEKYEEAIADFDKAIKLNTKNATAYEQRGLAK